MKSLAGIHAALRKNNRRQYWLLAGCCFFSVLLITAYLMVMRSPTVQTVLPEGGDSRKQMVMIFALAVLGCAVFTTYASGLFFRGKAKETGVLLALGATRRQVGVQLLAELLAMAITACLAGMALGGPIAWGIWQLFRLAVVDSAQMVLRFDPAAYLYALAFSGFVVLMLVCMLWRAVRRNNIMDVVNEARKSEPIHAVPRWYGLGGIGLLVGGAFLGYLTPAFCVEILRWYPPEWLTAIAYLPAFLGLYMILLHTVVNGWRRGKSRYKGIISTSMMRFQGRQTVRNMLVITVLVAGAYFAAFYTPMVSTAAGMGYDGRTADYAFHYRAGLDMPDEAEIRALAREHGAELTRFAEAEVALLAVDGSYMVETEGPMGTSYTWEYTELESGDRFIPASGYTALTGRQAPVEQGKLLTVFSSEGQDGLVANNEVGLVTNMATGLQTHFVPEEEVLCDTSLLGLHVLHDADYAAVTDGLGADWRETWVQFDVRDAEGSYAFAKALFEEIVARSPEEALVYDGWDPVVKIRMEAAGEEYFFDADKLEKNGFEPLDYSMKDAFSFRQYWQYMPQFTVLDRADFTKTMSVFLMLFIFVAVVCFAAVVVIAYTRSVTIGYTNAQVYGDLHRLGANNAYLLHTVRGQVGKVFFTPVLTGTVLILGFFTMILFFNDGQITANELSGLGVCLVVIAVASGILYGVYRATLQKVCKILGIRVK